MNSWQPTGSSLRLICLSLLVAVLFGCSSQPEKAAPKQEVEPVVSVLSDAEIKKIGRLYGPMAEERVRYWQQLIASSMDTEVSEKLRRTNDFFNGARFVDDTEVWQQSDYWATPLEFLIVDAGDCEDFTIAKYFTLDKMGVDPDKMRLTHVKSETLNKAHMVLAYYPSPAAVPLILDNIEVEIVPATEREDLRPIYSFNGEDLWLARTRTQQEKAGKASTIKRWQELQTRIEQGVPEFVVRGAVE